MENNLINFKDGSKIFFTSDLHFCHSNIIKFCNRPFTNVEEMNRKLIDNWNNTVPEDGIVFNLGDFVFGGSEAWKKYTSQLHGTHILIMGNHDRQNWRNSYKELFAEVFPQMQINIEGKSIYLNHYPFLCFGGAWKGETAVWQLFGHVHSGPNAKSGLDINRLVGLFPTQYDVGVDNNNFKPISFNKVKEIIYDQQMSLGLYKK